jgi:hypothetical protein
LYCGRAVSEDDGAVADEMHAPDANGTKSGCTSDCLEPIELSASSINFGEVQYLPAPDIGNAGAAAM